MKITFLGTSSMVPTKDRNHSAILLQHSAENILIDCGEGTQRQLRLADISATKLTKILITHWHADHVLGIPGLLQTLNANEYNKTLEVYGPKGTKNLFNKILNTYIHKGNRIKIKIFEISKSGKFYEDKNIHIECTYLKHSAPCLGYSIIEKDRRLMDVVYLKKIGLQGPLVGQLQRGKNIKFKDKTIKYKDATYIKKGKKITVITDTALCSQCYKLAKNSDLFICESTYTKDLEHKAKEMLHLTASQAALIAKKAKVKKLVLTHFSQRYKDLEEFKREAGKVFKNVDAAEDLKSFEL